MLRRRSDGGSNTCCDRFGLFTMGRLFAQASFVFIQTRNGGKDGKETFVFFRGDFFNIHLCYFYRSCPKRTTAGAFLQARTHISLLLSANISGAFFPRKNQNLLKDSAVIIQGRIRRIPCQADILLFKLTVFFLILPSHLPKQT